MENEIFNVGGDFVEFDLEAGQAMKVDTGCFVGWNIEK